MVRELALSPQMYGNGSHRDHFRCMNGTKCTNKAKQTHRNKYTLLQIRRPNRDIFEHNKDISGLVSGLQEILTHVMEWSSFIITFICDSN